MSKYNNTEKNLSLKMAAMNMIIRQETICYTLELIDNIKSLLK